MDVFDGRSTPRNTQIRRKRPRLSIGGKLGIAVLLTPYLSHAFLQNCKPLQRTNSYLQLEASLSALTVKELRQLVKESSAERGLLSSLKKKQDLINYLEESQKPDKLLALTNKTFVIEEEAIEQEATLSNDNNEIEEQVVPQQQPLKISPKDAIFEKVYERYPPIRNAPETNTTTPADDVRQLFHPIFKNTIASSDMDVVFVGTASCTPGTTRGVSCTALRLNWRPRAAFGASNSNTNDPDPSSTFQGGTWLFDVGECTQLQVQRSSAVKPSKITKIFLTHAHGDHTLGLVGLLCLMGQDRDREADRPPVEIYGPEGLRMWLRIAIRYSISRIVPPYRVHEIMDVPMAPEWELRPRFRRYFHNEYRVTNKGAQWGAKGLAGEDPISWISQANRMSLESSSFFSEAEGGRDIYPIYNHPRSFDGAPVWEVEDEGDVKVYAAPMSHGIPCVGYVVEELSRPGRLKNEYVEPIVKRNIAALRKAGFKVPMKAMAVIKNLPPGGAFTFPDGTVVTHEDAVEPPREGRKVVICGDTADSRALRGLAQNADVIIHEATNAYLQGVDKDTSFREVTRDAIIHGHSTPQIAGNFCKAVNGKRLILNHFSARYKGDVSVDSLSIMMRIEMQAMKASGLNETQVAAAWDLMVLPISQQ